MNVNQLNESEKLLNVISKGIQEVKGNDITILNLSKIETSICKYFVICSGTSNTHVLSISDSIRKFVSKEIKENPWSAEGKETCEWVLLDYIDIVIHIFQESTRDFYKLEDLWADAELKKINNLIK